jgi:hypothetical protein
MSSEKTVIQMLKHPSPFAQYRRYCGKSVIVPRIAELGGRWTARGHLE